eukprot:g17733.t1
MKKSVLYEVIHHTFRSCEVTCRTMMHVSFCVITKRLVNWWWCPFVFMNLVLPNLMVLVYGLCGFGIFCILMYLTLRMYEVVQEVMVTLGAEVRELTRSASADIDLNRADVDGLTPLMMACRRGHTEERP